jgi:uncharacterized membrane protein
MSEQNPFEKNERPIPAAWTNNPFKAPTAHVEDARSAGDGSLASEPNRVGAGQGSAWWSGGWGLFREATGLWIGMSIVLLILITIINLIPIVGPFASYILMPVISGGLMLGCRNLEDGEGLSFGHMFAGFQKNFGQLALVGLLYMLGIAAIVLIAFVLGLGGGISAAMMGGSAGTGVAFSTIMLGLLFGFALGIPLAMAIWFAPALVMLNDLTAIPAMKLSFQGCLRNIVPFLLYGIIGFVLAIIATIPLALGWLVLVPTMICSTYVSYKEIFVAQD